MNKIQVVIKNMKFFDFLCLHFIKLLLYCFQNLFLNKKQTKMKGEIIMNKKELINRLSLDMSMSKAQTQVVFEEMFDSIANLLANGEDVSIPKFGKFQVSVQPERQARNPKTGETVTVPEKQKVKFKPSTTLKERVQ